MSWMVIFPKNNNLSYRTPYRTPVYSRVESRLIKKNKRGKETAYYSPSLYGSVGYNEYLGTRLKNKT